MNLILLLMYVFVAVVLFCRRSDDRVALLASTTLVVFPLLQSTPILGPLVWPLLTEMVGFLGIVCMGFFFYLFPNGRFVPRGSRFCMLGWIGFWGTAVFLFCLIASQIALQVYRYRRVSTPVQRQQTKWVIFGFVLSFGSYGFNFALVYGLLFGFFHIHLSPLGNALSLLPSDLLLFLFPLFIDIAILRYRLWDIDILIKRTLVYAALTLSVIGLYMLVVVGLGTLTQIQGNALLSLLATGLIAVLFQPLRERLQRRVNRLLYGERDDPYAVLARLGSRLEATLVPEKVLPTIVETIAQALKLPYVAIALLPEQAPLTGTGAEVPDIVASSGMPTIDPVRVPLVYQAETVGSLLLATRAGDTFGQAGSRLLADLPRQAGVAVYAVRLTTHLQHLTESLQHARERLVTTREEERRRLRRDLHDGLGPALASLTFKVDAARNLLAQDSARTDRLLAEVRQQAQEAIADIRRLVYNLRPPALDELGLLSALREQVVHYQHQGLEVDFDIPSSLPPLPAAVEVAVYRIAQEALTNVARHAQAQHCLFRLCINSEALHLDISDDGQGIPAVHRIGVGLHTMHERARELGGSCTITPGSPSGTLIQVSLPRLLEKQVEAAAQQDVAIVRTNEVSAALLEE
jgi:signal transduction histidine kinase